MPDFYSNFYVKPSEVVDWIKRFRNRSSPASSFLISVNNMYQSKPQWNKSCFYYKCSRLFFLNDEFQFNPFDTNAPLLYPLKTSENQKIFWCFREKEKGCIGNEWVKESYIKNELPLSFSNWWTHNFILRGVLYRNTIFLFISKVSYRVGTNKKTLFG